MNRFSYHEELPKKKKKRNKDVHSDVLGICLSRLDPDRVPSGPIGIQHMFGIGTKYKRIRRSESEVLVS